MPNRVVRVGFLTSARVNRLSDASECLYHRLLLAVDDAGRLEGAPEIVKARTYPRSNRQVSQVDKALRECVDVGLVIVYECRGERYLQLMHWRRCGNARRSRYPWIDGSYRIQYIELDTPDGRCEYVATSVPEWLAENCPDLHIPSAWDGDPIGMGSRSNSIESDTKTNTKTNTETETSIYISSELNGISSEPPAAEDPVFLTFPCVGSHREWHLRESLLREWENLYPGLDIRAECRKALAWIQANRARRKTARGMTRFLVNWLNRAVEKRHAASCREHAAGPGQRHEADRSTAARGW